MHFPHIFFAKYQVQYILKVNEYFVFTWLLWCNGINEKKKIPLIFKNNSNFWSQMSFLLPKYIYMNINWCSFILYMYVYLIVKTIFTLILLLSSYLGDIMTFVYNIAKIAGSCTIYLHWIDKVWHNVNRNNTWLLKSSHWHNIHVTISEMSKSYRICISVPCEF